MSPQALHGEVKLKVRRTALLLREFTVSQLVRATGLNPESVRTEVQRLKQEGFLISEHQPGQREAVYRLTDDPEKRLELSRSVETFYPAPPETSRPTTRFYHAARHTLNQAERAKGREREELLTQAARQLEGAWEAEGASRAPDPVQAHLLRERGRLAYLRGVSLDEARRYFEQAREKFTAAGLEGEARLVDEYLLCLEIERRIKAQGMRDVPEQVRCVLEILQNAPTVGPLAYLLVDMIRALSSSEARVIAAIYQGMELYTTEMRETWRVELHERPSTPRPPWERPAWEEPRGMLLDLMGPRMLIGALSDPTRRRRGKPNA